MKMMNAILLHKVMMQAQDGIIVGPTIVNTYPVLVMAEFTE